MVKTMGAKDRVHKRKTRKDLGKRRKKYRGKPVKDYKRIRFEKRRGRKTCLKLMWWEQKPMSKEGYRNWSEKLRPKVKRLVYVPGIRVDTPVEQLATTKLLEQWALDNIGYEGTFYVKGFSGTQKNSYRVKPVKIFSVVIRDSPQGLHAKVINNWRAWRYWFWQGNSQRRKEQSIPFWEY